MPTIPDGETARGVLWRIVEGYFYLDVPDVARFAVTSGSRISVEPYPDARQSLVEHHLGMLPLAALVYQRGLLAFHAAALVAGQRVFLLAGDSGAGKSSLLAALLKRGWRMLADDLTLVGLDEKGRALVYPLAERISLWPDSLQQLDLQSASLPRIDANRYSFTPTVQAAVSPLPLSGIFRLSVHNKSVAEQEKLAPNLRFQALGGCLYNSHVADTLCSRAAYLHGMAAVAGVAPIRMLRRPRGRWSVDELADMVEATLHHKSDPEIQP
jgi:hypothetical protein